MELLGILRVHAILVAVSMSTYGLAAQFVQAMLLRRLIDAVTGNSGLKYTQEAIGWGYYFLIMSHLAIVLPALLIALLTLMFRFDPPYIWLGKWGRVLVITAAAVSFLGGSVCGWPS